MTATNQQMELWTGDTVVQPFWIVNEYGAPEDLSRYDSFTFAVRAKPQDPETVLVKSSPDGVVVQGDPTAGLLHVLIDSADTADYLVGGAQVELLHELEGIRESKTLTLAEGILLLHQSITGVGS